MRNHIQNGTLYGERRGGACEEHHLIRTETHRQMSPTRLEIPIFGPASASLAVSLGTARLELNAAGSYPAGGTTPSLTELSETRAALGAILAPAGNVPLRVMIRPRGPPGDGSPDFLYSGAEFLEMRESILAFKQSGLLDAGRGDGFVLGVLRRAGGGGARQVAVDLERNAELVDLARPFKTVFHRAFDDVVGSSALLHGQEGHDGQDRLLGAWQAALDDVVSCGFDGILTSGGPGDAPRNATVLKDIKTSAEGRVEIIVGGGVRNSDVRALALALYLNTCPIWLHSSCLTSESAPEVVDGQEVQAILQELEQL